MRVIKGVDLKLTLRADRSNPSGAVAALTHPLFSRSSTLLRKLETPAKTITCCV